MKHHLTRNLFCLALASFATGAIAGSEEALIELDKKWGSATVAGDTETVATLLADNLVSVSENGVGGKQEQLADNEPGPEGASYEPYDFKVMFLDENTAILFTSDHGTNVGERGTFGKTWTVHEQEGHVPLLIHVPGRGAGHSDGVAQPQDLFATVLGIAGVEAPADLAGYDLLRLAEQGRSAADLSAVPETGADLQGRRLGRVAQSA